MMTKFCPNCGELASSDVRFCRYCGTMLQHRTGPSTGSPTASPLAATIPLSAQTPITNDLAADAAPCPAETDASQVDRQELSKLWGHVTPGVISDVAASQNFATSSDGVSSTTPASGMTNATRALLNPTTPSTAPSKWRTPKSRVWRVWLTVAAAGGLLVLSCAAVGAVWFVSHRMRQSRAAVETNSAASATSMNDAKRQADAKIAEAERLLAAGDAVAATTRLREAVALDPTNAEAHRRLARLLVESGARRTALEEYRAVTQLDPNDADAWRQLASAQSDENLYGDAIESYQRLFALSAGAAADEKLQLSYADVLRLDNRIDEARAAYLKLTSSSDADIARAGKQSLAQLTPPATSNSKTSPSATRDERAATNANDAVETTAHPVATPAAAHPARPVIDTPAPIAPALAPADRYQHGVGLWATNRAAAVAEFQVAANAGNPDAYYYLGLNLAEGHDPHALSRAALVAALSYFQHARGSRFGAQARRYEDELGKEYDRRRSQ